MAKDKKTTVAKKENVVVPSKKEVTVVAETHSSPKTQRIKELEDTIKALKKSNRNLKKDKSSVTEKRPKTSYNIFCEDYRQELKKTTPDLEQKEIYRMCGKRWHELKEDSDQTKFESYKNAASAIKDAKTSKQEVTSPAKKGGKKVKA